MKNKHIYLIAIIAIFAAIVGCKKSQQKTANTNEITAEQKPLDLKSAAESGNAEAQYKLSKAYGEGVEMQKDILKQIEWLEKASIQNHPEANLELGHAYFLGTGVIQDKKHGMSLWKKSAELGNSEAQSIAGSFMSLGQYGEENVLEGIRFLRLAAEAGDKDAFSSLGSFYYTNEDHGNDVEAVKWLLISQLFGGDESDTLSRLEKNMSQEKFTEGERLAKEWYKINITAKK
jgi:TPR repeat protein